MSAYQSEQLEILRRIAERGKRFAESTHPRRNEEFVDLFVHLLDELERLKKAGAES